MERAFRPMRRKDRQLTEEDTWALLKQESYGVLSVTEEDGWPYGVPINYILREGCLYLHCSPSAYVVGAIARDDRVCFTVVPRAELVPEHITETYESVIVYGRAHLVEDPAQREELLRAFTFSLGQVPPEIGQRYIEKLGARTAFVCIRPEHVTGKANRHYIPVQKRLEL